jgi:hypothetical protein
LTCPQVGRDTVHDHSPSRFAGFAIGNSNRSAWIAASSAADNSHRLVSLTRPALTGAHSHGPGTCQRMRCPPAASSHPYVVAGCAPDLLRAANVLLFCANSRRRRGLRVGRHLGPERTAAGRIGCAVARYQQLYN